MLLLIILFCHLVWQGAQQLDDAGLTSLLNPANQGRVVMGQKPVDLLDPVRLYLAGFSDKLLESLQRASRHRAEAVAQEYIQQLRQEFSEAQGRELDDALQRFLPSLTETILQQLHPKCKIAEVGQIIQTCCHQAWRQVAVKMARGNVTRDTLAQDTHASEWLCELLTGACSGIRDKLVGKSNARSDQFCKRRLRKGQDFHLFKVCERFCIDASQHLQPAIDVAEVLGARERAEELHQPLQQHDTASYLEQLGRQYIQPALDHLRRLAQQPGV